MPPSKKLSDNVDSSDDDTFDEIGSDSSVHTSDDESSGDEIAPQPPVVVTKTLFYRYISTDPITKGSDKYDVIREGNLHLGLPSASDPLPSLAKDYSLIHDKASNEYISALRVKEDAAASIVRYYVFSNMATWTAQQRKLLAHPCKIQISIIANLSLAVHGMNGDTAYDKELLKHADLAAFRIDDADPAHLLDTPHAKKILEKAKRAKNKRKTADSSEAGATPKKKKVGSTAGDAKKKKAVVRKKVSPKLDITVSQTPATSPAKSGTTPSKAPAVQPKSTSSRQLTLSAPSPQLGPVVYSPSVKRNSNTKPVAVQMATLVPVLTHALPHLLDFFKAIGVDATVVKK